jgi:DNA-directed RNA polymerase specialized sigma24 family protein
VNRGTELQQRFATLLDQHAGIVWRVAYAWCRQSADRDDLVQEIHYQLYRIALNVAISNDRRRKRTHEERLLDFPEPVGSISPPAEDGRISELFQIIDGLDPTNRALLLLWLDDQSYAAIAEVLGLSETNVATRLSRLKQKLKTQFE